MGRVNAVTDVPGKVLYVASGPGAQVDAAEFLAGNGVNHPEVVCRNLVDSVRREGNKFQL